MLLFARMVTELEQHGAGIDLGVSPEAIKEREVMWSNRRKELRDRVQMENPEDLHNVEGKKLTSKINELVGVEVRKRLKNGEYKNLREKVMYESWDMLESALDVEKMTPFAVEDMLDKFVETAEKNQPAKDTKEQEAIRQKEEEEKQRAQMKESLRKAHEEGVEPEEVRTLADKIKEKKEELELAKWMTMMLEKDKPVESDPDKRKEQFENWKREYEGEVEQEVA